VNIFTKREIVYFVRPLYFSFLSLPFSSAIDFRKRKIWLDGNSYHIYSSNLSRGAKVEYFIHKHCVHVLVWGPNRTVCVPRIDQIIIK